MEAKTKKAIRITLRVLSWMLIAFSVITMLFTLFTVSTVDKHDRQIFGYRFYIVKSDSMSLSENNKDMDVHFKAGDIVIIKSVNPKTELQDGDIISFLFQGENDDEFEFGDTVTHMIRRVVKRDGEVIGFITFGTNKGIDDEVPVKPEYVLGKYTGKLPGVGNFFAFVKSTPGYLLCIFLPFLLLILYNGAIVIRLFKAYKKEQNDIAKAEKAEIAADRQKNEEMMRELLALKAELERKSAALDNANTGNTEASPEQNRASEDNGQV